MKTNILFLLIISLMFGYALPAASAQSFEESTAVICEQYSSSSENSFNCSFSKECYEFDEEITVLFSCSGEVEDIQISYTSNGFALKSPLPSSTSTVNITLLYDGITENPQFTLNWVIDGETFSQMIYGARTDRGLFISDGSVDTAWDHYFYSKVLDGTYTMEDYNSALQNYFDSLEDPDVTYTVSRTSSGSGSERAVSPVTVTGTLTWVDDSGNIHPLQYTTVEVYDMLEGEVLGTVYTDVNGTYTYAFINTAFSGMLRLSVYPGGEDCLVTTENGGSYILASATQTSVSHGDTVTLNVQVNMNSTRGQAFQISQAVNVAALYAKTMNGSSMPDVTVLYPNNSADNCCYSGNVINIIESISSYYSLHPYSSWDVIMHEYGHHVQHYLGITQSPGLNHESTNDLAAQYGKDAGIRLAWPEAHASVFSGMAQQYYATTLSNIYKVGDPFYHSYNNSFVSYEGTSHKLGEACEQSIIGVLWDIYDSGSTESHDRISLGHTTFWTVVKNSGATTLSAFAQYFVNYRYSMYKYSFGAILEYYEIGAFNIQWNTSGLLGPRILWSAGGIDSMPNNYFTIHIYSNTGALLLTKTVTGATCSYTMTEADMTILENNGQTFKIVITAYQKSTPETGGYISDQFVFQIV